MSQSITTDDYIVERTESTCNGRITTHFNMNNEVYITYQPFSSLNDIVKKSVDDCSKRSRDDNSNNRHSEFIEEIDENGCIKLIELYRYSKEIYNLKKIGDYHYCGEYLKEMSIINSEESPHIVTSFIHFIKIDEFNIVRVEDYRDNLYIHIGHRMEIISKNDIDKSCERCIDDILNVIKTYWRHNLQD